MKNKIFQIVFIIIFVILTVMNFSTILILCFGENGHVQLEIEKILIQNPSANLEVYNESNSVKKFYYKPLNSKCGECNDIPILFNFMTSNIIINSNHYLEYKHPIKSIPLNLLVNQEIIILKIERKIKQSASIFNTILQKMSLLI